MTQGQFLIGSRRILLKIKLAQSMFCKMVNLTFESGH